MTAHYWITVSTWAGFYTLLAVALRPVVDAAFTQHRRNRQR